MLKPDLNIKSNTGLTQQVTLWLFMMLFLCSSTAKLFSQSDKAVYYKPDDKQVCEKLEHWQDLKFGLMMHWGPYSVLGAVESWSICAEDEPWCFRGDDYIKYKQEYEKLPEQFNPSGFEPKVWAKAASDAGMKYIVFTTKHHDGFCMFNTATTDYSITGSKSAFRNNPRADITKEIFSAFRSEGFMIGAYFSKADWHTEYYWSPGYATPDRNVNYDISKHPDLWKKFVGYTQNQIDELASNYGSLDILWLDGGWVQPLRPEEEAFSRVLDGLYRQRGYTQLRIPQNQDINMDQIVEKARKKQPGMIVVDRGVEGKNENYLTPEQTIPTEYLEYPWETCMTMGGSWSYSFHENYKPAGTIIHMLSDIVSKGGNLLLNIGPGPDGKWDPEAYKRLGEIGKWLKVNGEAIYNTRGMKNFAEGKFRFTKGNDGRIFAIYLADVGEVKIPGKLIIESLSPAAGSEIHLLGYARPLKWEKLGNAICLNIPDDARNNPPSEYAWVFSISGKR